MDHSAIPGARFIVAPGFTPAVVDYCLEHRIAILRKKQEQDHLEMTIPDDVLRFIAEHVRSNVRELEGCIIKLLLFASLKHKEVSIELAREALG